MNALLAIRYFANLLGQVIQDETFLDFSQLERKFENDPWKSHKITVIN